MELKNEYQCDIRSPAPKFPKLQDSALVDLLDRVLDKGLVIQADIVVTLAGVPLLGVNLRAALANMDSMINYGMMKDMDENIRMENQKIKEELVK